MKWRCYLFGHHYRIAKCDCCFRCTNCNQYGGENVRSWIEL